MDISDATANIRIANNPASNSQKQHPVTSTLGQTPLHVSTDLRYANPIPQQFQQQQPNLASNIPHQHTTFTVNQQQLQASPRQLPTLFVAPVVHLPLHPSTTTAAHPVAVARRPAPIPTIPTGCALCGVRGTTANCGQLVSTVCRGAAVQIHHGCAVWAPQVYQTEDSDEYKNLNVELDKSKTQSCAICGDVGASITCCHPGCTAIYHLPCALDASDVVLNRTAFELWCPNHVLSESEEEHIAPSPTKRGRGRPPVVDDEDFSLLSVRPRRNAALSRKHRLQRGSSYNLSSQHQQQRHHSVDPSSNTTEGTSNSGALGGGGGSGSGDGGGSFGGGGGGHRPRTDWQRRGDMWLKAVPPWWCENKTVHFANKVFRELFHSGTSATLIDEHGTERICTVDAETRNDLRLQYTLGGEFAEYWDTVGIKAGDHLTFQRESCGGDGNGGKIVVRKYHQGIGIPNNGTGTTSGGGTASQQVQQQGGYGRSTTVSLRQQQQQQQQQQLQQQGSFQSAMTTIAKDSFNNNNNVFSGTVMGNDNTTTAITTITAGAGVVAITTGGSTQQQQQHRTPPLGLRTTSNTRSTPGSGSHPNRWMDLLDGSAVKTIYKSTLVHQQCPIAGWLFRKLYDRLPVDVDQAVMYDPVLGREYTFEVLFISAANVHYLAGRAFSAWLKESGIKAGEQISLLPDTTTGRVIINRLSKHAQQHGQYEHAVPAGEGEYGAADPTTLTTLFNYNNTATATAMYQLPDLQHHQQQGYQYPHQSPAVNNAMGALDALAAAAGYARKHGTPAIQALLSGLPPEQLSQIFPTIHEGNTPQPPLHQQQHLGMSPTAAAAATLPMDPRPEATVIEPILIIPPQHQVSFEDIEEAVAAVHATTTSTGGGGGSSSPGQQQPQQQQAVAEWTSALAAIQNNNTTNTGGGGAGTTNTAITTSTSTKRAATQPPIPLEAFLQLLKHQRMANNNNNTAAATAGGAATSVRHTTTAPATNDLAQALLRAHNLHITNNNSTTNNGTTTTGTTARPTMLSNAMPALTSLSQQHRNTAAMFAGILQVLGKHQWTPMEQAAVLRFRAKYPVIDGAAREVVHMNVMALQDDKAALYEVLKAVAFGSSNSPAVLGNMVRPNSGGTATGTATVPQQAQQQQEKQDTRQNSTDLSNE